MSLKYIPQIIIVLILSFVKIASACNLEETANHDFSRNLVSVLLERYAPATLPMTFFRKLSEAEAFTYENGVIYSIENKEGFSAKLPYNLPISDYVFGHQETLEVKSIIQDLRFIPKEESGYSKMILNYAYPGRYGSGQQVLTFYAHIRSEDEELVTGLKDQQDKSSTLKAFEMNEEDDITIFHQKGEEFIGTIKLDEMEDKDTISVLEKIKGMSKFVGPYVLNDVIQGQATKVIPEPLLAAVNMASAQAGYDTVVHATVGSSTEIPQEDPLDSKRAELTRRSEAIGAALTPIPGASRIRTALNLACQFAGYDSATHWWYSVPAKMKGDTPEVDSYQRKINLAKGAARFAIVLFVPGGKFVVIGSKIYEFVQGKSVTETIAEKVATS
ncbi:MAG: hypothetical protein BGO77_02540 [Caedibacter sp. 37-49]|nr:MAG: hypothetical protein BGO77_02540 [Caedibacter sp. 37-49]